MALYISKHRAIQDGVAAVNNGYANVYTIRFVMRRNKDTAQPECGYLLILR